MQDRYSSPRALADDIEHWLADEPVSAWREPLTVRARRWLKRHRTMMTGAAAAVLVATASLAIATVLLTAAKEREHAAKERERAAKEVLLKQDEQARFARHLDTGDAALFRCLTGQRPTWLPSIIEAHRQQGINAYGAALEINPNAVWPLVQRGRLHASNRQSLELALTDFDKAHQDQPGYASIQKFRGQVLKRLGRDEAAQAAFEKAKTLYPTTAEDLYWLGNIAHSKDQDLAAAQSYFSQALLLSPDHYWSRLERAEWGLPVGTPAEFDSRRRIAEFTTAKALRPDLPFASESLVLWQKTIDMSSKQELQEQIDRFGLDILRAHEMAGILEKEGKPDEAEALLRKVLEQDTGGWTAEKIGEMKHRLGKYAEAIEWYQRAIKEGMKYTSLYLQLANAFTVLQDFQAAEQTYRRGITEHPNEPLFFYELAKWYGARGRLLEAEETYKAGCQLPVHFKKSSDADEPPDIVDNTGELKVCYQLYALHLGKASRNQEMINLLKHAIERLEKAHAAKPQPDKTVRRSSSDASFLKELLGQQYIYAGRRQETLALIDAEMKTKPLSGDQAHMVKSLLNLLGMKEQALDVARIAEFAVRDDRLLLRKAAATSVDGQLRSLGRYRELVDRIETRRALGDSLDIFDYKILGMWYTGDEALAIYKEAIATHPKSHSLQTDHMSLLAKQGRKEDARKAYETARDLFFEEVATSSKPASPSLLLGGDQLQSRYPWPWADAMPWYSYLMEQGKHEELNDLDIRLRDASIKIGCLFSAPLAGGRGKSHNP